MADRTGAPQQQATSGPQQRTTSDKQQGISLPSVAEELLEIARQTHAGRAGRTLNPGAGAALKQTVLALVAGQSLADHESPAAATLQVLLGRVRLTANGEGFELAQGDLMAIPPARHGLDALVDAAVLISVGQGPARQTEAPTGMGLPD